VILPDVLVDDLVVVFSGTAVASEPLKREAYYAGSGNKFWRILHQTRLTSRELRPEEYQLLLAHDIGLADLVKLRTANDADLSDADYDIKGFKKKISENKPLIVAFNGKEASKRVLGRETVKYGRQTEKLESALVYVLPSTSKLAHDFWNEKYWQELADEVKRLRKGR
jgi:TDG/mug DNA glycosylase family protein